MPRIQAATVAEHRAAQRRAILAAARDILAEGGTEAPSLAAVAKRTGLARPSVYKYFKSSADLLNAVIDDIFPRWSRHVAEQMAAAHGPGERVLTYVAANLHLVAQGDHAVVRGLSAMMPVESLAEPSRVFHEELHGPLVAALTEVGVPDPAGMAELIQAVLYTASRMIESGAPEERAVALTRELLAPYLSQAAKDARHR